MTLLDKKYTLGHIPLPRNFQKGAHRHKLEFAVTPEDNLRLTTFVPPEAMFGNYTYRSQLVEESHVLTRMEVGEKAYTAMAGAKPTRICEVACNDGYMLNRYAKRRFSQVLGIEPAVNLHRYIDGRVKVYGDYFTEQCASTCAQADGLFHVVFAANCVAHTPDPVDMLKGIAAILSDDGVAVVQFQYLIDMLKRTQFYHMYHEHYHYFTVKGFKRVAEEAGLKLLTAQRVPEHGGSMLCTLAKPSTGASDKDVAFHPDFMTQQEFEYLSKGDRLQGFMDNTNRRLCRLVGHVNKQPVNSIHGIFASAKATVILNLAVDRGMELDRFCAFYDDAAELWGQCVPGTEIPIKALHPIEKASGQAILFAPSLMGRAKDRLPDAAITNIEDIFNG